MSLEQLRGIHAVTAARQRVPPVTGVRQERRGIKGSSEKRSPALPREVDFMIVGSFGHIATETVRDHGSVSPR